MTRYVVVLIAAALGAAVAPPAQAAGGFDGTWVIDIPPSIVRGSATSGPCPALRLRATISDSKITASLERVAGGAPNTIENGTGRSSGPLTGTVQPDGSVSADWQGYRAAGKLSGDAGTVTVQGQCGPRDATVVRVAK
jgi:hypothetical protein